jgi:hypothetical protein
MNRQWLLDNADIPIKYNLLKSKQWHEELLKNEEVDYWLSLLKGHSLKYIHGSFDCCFENIIGKLWILGLSKEISEFNLDIKFVLDFLDKQVNKQYAEELTFDKLYTYRDYETILACYLPFMGYHNEKSVKYITGKRINILYEFTKQKRYDIYVDGSKFKGVKKEWQPYVINPNLYSDGNIALPSIHDLILFSGMYKHLDKENRQKIETVVQWIFNERHDEIIGNYGYFYFPDELYNAKAVLFKVYLPHLICIDKRAQRGLLFTCAVLSYFTSAENSKWFQQAMQYLNQFKTSDNRYCFPRHMVSEKPNCYLIGGGHMNVGEDKKSKLYTEIISTYWMEKIKNNINRCPQ